MNAEFNINKVIKEKPPCIRIAIKGLRFFRFRVWCGVQVIKFGIWICGFTSVSVEAEDA